MQNVIEIQDTIKITGSVIAADVSYEEFLRKFYGQHVGWISGVVIQMSPVSKDQRLRRIDPVFDLHITQGNQGDPVSW